MPPSLTALLFTLMCLPTATAAGADAPAAPAPAVLFEDVAVFDGHVEHLTPRMQVLAVGNRIEQMSLVAEPGKNFLVIMKDGKVDKNLLASG